MNAKITVTRFPVTTSVSAYPVSAWPGGLISGAPAGASVATASVAADHTLTFTGLDANKDYVAYAQVSSVDTYRRFRTEKVEGGGRFWIPGNGKAATMERGAAASNVSALTSGTIYAAGGERAVLRKGDRVTVVGMLSATTALSGGTHSWAGIADAQTRKVLARSADDTTATLAANTAKEFTLSAEYVADVDLAIYFFMCFVGTVPTVQGRTLNNAATSAQVPILCGNTADTGQTTPPAVGATLGAITGGTPLALMYCR